MINIELKVYIYLFSNSRSKYSLKQVAGIPITSFDRTKIDSDLDTVRSEAIRGKIEEYRNFHNKEDGI